ncbi:hypothetical protein [Aquisediminimonas profunda]|uniref:hypothetical protein n=1 Tax=Aquisediminimonas profunda TaxID=1550733 RepID=UPI001C629683|nr:hypothetical protein [Aquisediminimonas profunda]
MNVFEMVVLIVAISAIASILRAKYGVTRKRGAQHLADALDANRMQDADSARMREEIKTLKERIAVLERLATDTNSAVALDREIEKLR